MSFVQYVCHSYNFVSLRVSFAKPHQNLGLFFQSTQCRCQLQSIFFSTVLYSYNTCFSNWVSSADCSETLRNLVSASITCKFKGLAALYK